MNSLRLPVVIGIGVGESARIRGDHGQLFVAIFHFFLKARLNSQFVPLNNSGSFIYFEFSSHCSSLPWPMYLCYASATQNASSSSIYCMYKGSSRDFLRNPPELALRAFATRCEENTEMCMCVLRGWWGSLSQSLSEHRGKKYKCLHLWFFVIPVFFVIRNDRVLAATEKTSSQVHVRTGAGKHMNMPPSQTRLCLLTLRKLFIIY